MNIKNLTKQILYDEGKKSPAVRFVSLFLWSGSQLYRVGIILRAFLYHVRLFPSYKPETRIVSIGNITLGGTGKTPLVMYLARMLKASGLNVLILLRGYHRIGKGIDIVSDGSKLLIKPEEAGDEAVIYSRNLDVPILVGKNRVLASMLAIKKFHPDVILVDDGFQHLRLKRDLDIVTIDAVNPFGSGYLLPRGILREPLSALRRAHIFVINRADRLSGKNDLVFWIRNINPDAPVVFAQHRAQSFINLKNEKEVSIDEFRSKVKEVFAVSSIGNPAAFIMTLEDLGIKPVGTFAFLDHHMYREKDIKTIEKMANEFGAEAIVATEKDMVSFPKEVPFSMPVYILKVEMDIIKGKDTLEKTLMQTCSD